MTPADALPTSLSAEVCVRALEARDPRFDGVFFVGITSTGIYCRPICPARVSRPENRRFFRLAAAAEGAGFRPCRRCRPELAPGMGLVDSVSRLAYAAERRIAAGALNGRPVRELARDLCVGERHLRRALQRELGVSPVQLAQTHRLLLARRLLADTHLPVSAIAYASGFQSLRRFNAVFRKCYGLNPRACRPGRQPREPSPGAGALGDGQADGSLTISLAYRAPFNWQALLGSLRARALPGVEVVSGATYARSVSLDGHTGVITVQDGPTGSGRRPEHGCLTIEVAASLIAVLMPLIARLRHLFDLDAEPAVIEGVLAAGGLDGLVRRHAGLRIPGAFDAFEVGLALLLSSPSNRGHGSQELVRRVIREFGVPAGDACPGVTYFAPSPKQVAGAGEAALRGLGAPADRARAIVAFAGAVDDGTLQLGPGGDPQQSLAALLALPGMDERLANALIGRTLAWPDHFDAADPQLQRASEAAGMPELEARAARWRPWRAYAAQFLLANAAD